MGIFDLRKKENALVAAPQEKPKMEESIHGRAVIDFTNPFSKQNLERVFIHIYKDHRDSIIFSGEIKYATGNSSGAHKVEAESFQGLVDKLNLCIGNIGL
jgi:hypothetical protein